jgi:hypothetical protein
MSLLSLVRDWKLTEKPITSAFVAPITVQEPHMATSPVVPAHQSFLQHLGSIFKKILHIGEEVATIASPFVTAYFPDVAPLFKNTLGFIMAEEATINATPGSGAQKLANVVSKSFADAQTFFTANGIVIDQVQWSKIVSTFVDTVNLIPAPTKALPTIAVPSA